jgi:hypothetical protein
MTKWTLEDNELGIRLGHQVWGIKVKASPILKYKTAPNLESFNLDRHKPTQPYLKGQSPYLY